MSLCSWNARGLGSPRAFRNLSLLVKQHQPILFFVMETKLQPGRGLYFKNKLHFDNVLEVPRQGLGGGLLLFWNNCIDVTITTYSYNQVDCIISNFNDMKWHFTGYYGSPYPDQKSVTWNLLNRLYDDAPLSPWLIIGDFNDYLSVSDKNLTTVPPIHAMHHFHSFLNKGNHLPLNHSGNKFTWRHGLILERLDWCTVNQSWKNLFPRASLFHLGFYGSDHRALKVQLEDKLSNTQSHTRFHLENHWLNDPSFSNTINSSWCLSTTFPSFPLQNFLAKQSYCLSAIKDWSSSQYPLKVQIARTQTELHRVLNNTKPTTQSLQQATFLQSNLDGLLQKDEIYWKQRAKVDWLRAGDKNTKVFHHKASIRKKNNFIRGISLPDGSVAHDSPTILSQFLNFYFNLFHTQGVNKMAINSILQGITSRLSPVQKTFLDEAFTEDEIKKTTFSLSWDKAPGPDGLNSLFYQKHWHLFGSELCQALLHILNHNGDISLINETILVLIPKKKNAKTVCDFQPTSLCNTLYKCLSKVLANRIKRVLHSVIAPNQSSILTSRQISDNILIANEIIHAIHSRKLGKICWVVIKLDMEKAFDRVEWHFLSHLLAHVVFPSNFISLIMNCLSTVTYLLSLNGILSDTFFSSRGIRQGDPLSPYIFLLVAESLSTVIRLQETADVFSGIKICTGAPSLSHLLFAEDSMLFAPVTPHSSEAINSILHTYHQATGQLVNRDKSSILFSTNTSQDSQHRFQTALQLASEGFISKYLGVPHCVGRVTNISFHYLIQNVSSKMNIWYDKFYSRAGKETLIKAIIQPILSFAMSYFKIPKSICQTIQRLVSKFWWGYTSNIRKIHWKKGSALSVSKFFRGLGFRTLTHHNQALLAKQAWRVWSNPDSLLHSILKARYFKNSDFLLGPNGYNSSFIWRSLLWGRQLLKKGLVWKIGSGNDIPISASNWIPGISHPTLLHPIDPSLSVVSFFINPNSTWINVAKARTVWKHSKFKFFHTNHQRLDIQEFYLQGLHLISKEDLRLFEYKEAQKIHNAAISASNSRQQSSSSISTTTGIIQDYSPALYVVAALDQDNCITGFGFVFKIGLNQIVASAMAHKPGASTPIFAEGQALLEGISWCVSSQLKPDLIFTHCLNLVSKVNGRSGIPSPTSLMPL
uniref:Reverse transcriptase domain-containing protein n=1 Tax=Cannabis sativa TaxID=3483 RepID=A0A803P542_CANSA